MQMLLMGLDVSPDQSCGKFLSVFLATVSFQSRCVWQMSEINSFATVKAKLLQWHRSYKCTKPQ